MFLKHNPISESLHMYQTTLCFNTIAGTIDRCKQCQTTPLKSINVVDRQRWVTWAIHDTIDTVYDSSANQTAVWVFWTDVKLKVIVYTTLLPRHLIIAQVPHIGLKHVECRDGHRSLVPGPCLTTAIWRCRNDFNQWQRRFHWNHCWL